MKKTSITLVLVFSLLSLLAGCKGQQINQEKPKEDKAYIENVTEQPLSEQGAQLILRIESSKKWKIEWQKGTGAWVETDQNLEGQGDKAITLFVQPNPSFEERTGELTVFFPTTTITVTFRQKPSLLPDNPITPPDKRMEIPLLSNDKNHKFIDYKVSLGGTTIVNYSQEYDLKEKHNRWVAFRFDAITSQRKVGRTDAWSCDPNLPDNVCIGGTFPSGTDRGHLVASSDRSFSREANMQTFYYSNISPQKSSFNQGIWQKLEERVLQWGRDRNSCDTLYVVKGGTIYNGDIWGHISPKNNSALSVPIPKYYFMALLKVKDGKHYSIGFIIEHKDIPTSNKLGLYTITIKELEQRTGYNFFHVLPDEKEKDVESKIDIAFWQGI
ncbi:DNA/RNA non-specific endonuclease [Porphyromonas canoris]|uniref:DNA/RNA non-specific endonuclease n=1 Tax=Porphyromonas canoris TaxID=36875 RepID=UPI00069066C0|nr:DNA/RNA non-specific endonuclease [Porphyromonas canoris]